MAGWDGEIFLHATTRMSMVSYFFKTLFKSHKWPKWISSQHYPYVVSRENLTRINKNYHQWENQQRYFAECRTPMLNDSWSLSID